MVYVDFLHGVYGIWYKYPTTCPLLSQVRAEERSEPAYWL